MENEEQIETTEEEVVEDDFIEVEYENTEEEVDTTDWKAEAIKQKAIANRYKNKANKTKEETPKQNLKTNDDEIDYGHINFFNEDSEVKITKKDLTFLKETMEETGLSQKKLLEKSWFKGALKDDQTNRAVKAAIPSNTKRTSTQTNNTVDYWLAKGELPPVNQVQLRRDVLNARIKAETQKSQFSDNSIVMS
jgi:hypothetical protein